MELSAEDEAWLLTRSESLAARVQRLGHASSAEVGADDPEVALRLDRWCDVVARGDVDLFSRRLSLDSLNVAAVRRALALSANTSGHVAGQWIYNVRQALAAFDASGQAAVRPAPPRPPHPFEEVYAPFRAFARQQVRERLRPPRGLIADDAYCQLEEVLLQRLAFVLARSLQLQFSVYRARRQSSLGRLLASADAATGDQLYRDFVGRLLDGDLVSFYREYPVLARLTAMVCESWVDFVVEFAQRAAHDHRAIRKRFANGAGLGKVASIRPTFSDPHNEGRSVIAVEFDSGLRLVYKPKPVGLEAQWSNVVSWLNDQPGIPLDLFAAKVLDREDYGWVELVDHRPCDTDDEAARFYRRSGMLVCLVYAFQGTDFHHENVIAHGEHPVLIDLETIVHPRAREVGGRDDGEAHVRARRHFEHSVLRTGLLPTWDIAPGGLAYDVSGLGGIHEWAFQRLEWEDLNTDAMRLLHQSAVVGREPNAPTRDGEPLDPSEFVDEIVDGFCALYRWLSQRRESLIAPDGPLAGFAEQRARYVFRPTKVYGALLDKLSHPRHFRVGVDRSVELEVLTQGVFEEGADSPWWPILKQEQQALERLDIPHFTVAVNDRGLTLPSGGFMADFFEASAWEQMCTRLQTLGDEDLAQQVALMRAAFHFGTSEQAEHSAPDDPVPASGVADAATPEELLHHARLIAAELEDRAIRAGDGTVDWICPNYVTQAQRFQLQPIGYSLYDGTAGLAIFFGALERLHPSGEFGELALRTLRPLLETLRRRTSRNPLAAYIGIGGTSGLGSVIYGLAKTSSLVNEPSLLEDARLAATLVTEDEIDAAANLDVTDGLAGTVLGLLALHSETRESRLLEVAAMCGKRLVRDRTASAAGPRTWATLEGALLTGFSHGAAGIAYALLRLYKATGSDEFLEAAREGIAYERTQFSPEAGNWPDFRRTPGQDGADVGYMTSWCHGAPGIGLARLGALDVLDTAEVRRDIEAGLATTIEYGVQGADHLCCGNLGRLDLLLEAAARLERPHLVEEARRQANQVLARAAQEGGFLLNIKPPPGMYMPGLFNGLSGIGYELLRLAAPWELPSVLAWE